MMNGGSGEVDSDSVEGEHWDGRGGGGGGGGGEEGRGGEEEAPLHEADWLPDWHLFVIGFPVPQVRGWEELISLWKRGCGHVCFYRRF